MLFSGIRSSLIILILLALFYGCTQVKYPKMDDSLMHLYDKSLAPFYHGVASGDPLPDAVIIWTRATPEDSLPSVTVSWEVSPDEGFNHVVREGESTTGPEKDYTLKVDVKGLDPGKEYFYRFRAFDSYSITGYTKTAPVKTDSLSFGVVSCSNYEWGYFNAYAGLADYDLDAVIHLGDYIYEYGPGTYGDSLIKRTHLPEKELIKLSDYRIRYAQYRLDKDLIKAHQKHPFINIWDDHEISNDSYKDGAQNHQNDEGSFEKRKADAIQAYYEWIPIRKERTLYRDFQFGDLAEIFMLDERMEGRTEQADSLTDPSLMSEERSMLGKEQLSWLKEGLGSSKATWKIIGNQVIFSYLNYHFEPNFTINLDSWDGYPVERQNIADFIQDNGIENTVFVTGDTHSSWAFEVAVQPFEQYDHETGKGAFAVEFGTPSVSSSNPNERFADSLVIAHEKKIVNSPINPHLKFANLRDHGFTILRLNKNLATAEWYYVETLSEPSDSLRRGMTASVQSGQHRIELNQ